MGWKMPFSWRQNINRIHRHTFCPCDLDLDPITLTYELDLAILHTEMNILGQGIRKLKSRSTADSLSLSLTLLNCNSNCNCNWGTCIAPPTRRPRAHLRVNPYPGARRQNETKMFSDHDETSLLIAAVSPPSVACSTLAVQQQKRLCRQFVDVSAARRGCQTMKHAV